MKTIYKYIPYEKLTITSTYKTDEVLRKIAEITDMDQRFGRYFTGIFKKQSTIKYVGRVTENGFDISRIIFYKNSFLPVIIGEVRDLPFGSEIDLTLRMNWFVILFGFFWMGAVTVACVMVLFFMITTGIKEAGMIVPFIMWGFGVTLFLGAFKYESIRSRKHLMELLNAQEKGNLY